MKRGLRTQTRVLLAGLIPMLILALLLTAYLIKIRQDENQLGFEQQGQAYAKELAAASRYGLFIDDAALLDQVARQTLAIDHVYSVEIRNPDDKLLVSSVSDRYSESGGVGLQRFDVPVFSIVVPLTEGDVTYETDVPEAEPVSLGQVSVTLTSADVQKRNRKITFNSLLITLGGFFLASVLLWLASRRITRPIDRITRLVKHAESGQFNERVTTTSSGELGELEVGVNTMMEALDHHKSELIEQVEAATEELQIRNAQLDKARQDAIVASKVKSEFLAHMSHEIRTPMNGIIGFVDLLRKTELDRSQQSQLGIIKQSAGDLLGVINQILDFSKIESGKIDLKHRPVNLNKLVASVCQLMVPQAQEKSVELSLDVDEELPELLGGDQLRLRQIASNLISNAIKYTDAGSVTVRLEADKTQDDLYDVRLYVEDTGIGIDEQDQKTLFEPFTQADIENRQYYQGTGLGLAIVRRLVAAMDGEVTVKSRIGEGSHFRVSLLLPLATSADDIDYREAAASEVDKDLSGQRILVVDDNRINRHLLESMLGEMGAQVDTAVDGEDAVEAAKVRHYDLILMDVHMPKMDGLQASRYIRALGSYDDVPIIALSADAVSKDEIAREEPEIDCYLTKPINEDALLNAVRSGRRESPDVSASQQTTGKPQGLLDELLGLFREELPQQVKALEQAVADGHWQGVRELLHKIKGAAAVCDVDALYQRIEQMQEAIKDEEYQLAELFLARLREEALAIIDS